MKNKLLTLFRDNFPTGSFIRVGENKSINLYIGRDMEGRYSFDYRGAFIPVRVIGSGVIAVNHIKSDTTDETFLRFSLTNAELLEYFCTFCADIIDSTIDVIDDKQAYKIICDRYFAWKKLFKPQQGKLAENELMGLIGEMLFMRDYMLRMYPAITAIESWTGPEPAHKDYSVDDAWYEVKTITVGKDSVKISSLEQLDSDTQGTLVVYALEKMSPTYNGVRINKLVTSILDKVQTPMLRELFLTKLTMAGFEFNPENDKFVYDIHDFMTYKVDETFPKLSNKNIPLAINKVQYEIILSEIEDYKITI